MDTDDILVARKAFMVYRDHLVRDVLTKNKDLEVVNKSMERAKTLLSSVQIYQSSKTQEERIINVVWKEFSLLDNHEDTGTHLIYQEEGEDLNNRTIIPIENIIRLQAKISGYDSPIRRHFERIAINHEVGTVEMEYYCSQLISISGEIINISGSLNELEEISNDSDRLKNYFVRFLRTTRDIDSNTGLPIYPPSATTTCLDGAMLVLRSIKISKENMSVQDLIADLKCRDKINEKYKTDTLFQELELLRNVDGDQFQELNALASKRKGLLMRNSSLEFVWDWLKYLIVNVPYDNGESYRLLSMDFLTDGYFDTCVFDNVPVMKFEVSEEDGSGLLIESIMGLKVRLGHDLSKSPAEFFGRARLRFETDANRGIWLRCGPNIGAYFAVDESGNNIRWLVYKFLQLIQHPMVEVYDLEDLDFTMRLKYITIHLDAIQQQLDVLGVDTVAAS